MFTADTSHTMGTPRKPSAHIPALSGSLTNGFARRGKRYPATLSAKLGEGVEVLLARRDAQGDAEAAGMLGEALKSRGDSAGAEAAFRRSQERGALAGSVSLGKLLVEER